jgi:hypothetical protein
LPIIILLNEYGLPKVYHTSIHIEKYATGRDGDISRCNLRGTYEERKRNEGKGGKTLKLIGEN